MLHIVQSLLSENIMIREQNDLHLECITCRAPFVVSAAEQQFFAMRALACPRRCKPCRAARKAQYGATTQPTMIAGE